MIDKNNRYRLLKVKEILEKETDEEHGLSYQEIADKLAKEFGYECKIDKKAIMRDIEALRDFGLDIIDGESKYNKKFFKHLDKKFDYCELKMLIDVVSAAKSIPQKETQKLIDKISSLTSCHNEKCLKEQLCLDKSVKYEDKGVKFIYKINNISQAVTENKMISFCYGRYDFNKKFKISEVCIIFKPYNLIWDNGFYYVIGERDGFGGLSNYRVDRMDNVDVLKTKFKAYKTDISEYVSKNINMFPGDIKPIKIKLKKDEKLLNVVYDRFGIDNVKVLEIKNNYIILRTYSAITKGLLYWILSLGANVKVLSPEILVEMVIDTIEKLSNSYKNS